jgi:TPR repeat protein
MREIQDTRVSDKEASRTGKQLFYGVGCKKNYKRAFVYLLQAANAGYVHSQNLVGYCFIKGLGDRRCAGRDFYPLGGGAPGGLLGAYVGGHLGSREGAVMGMAAMCACKGLGLLIIQICHNIIPIL